MPRYFKDIKEFQIFTRKVGSSKVKMVRAPDEMGKVAILKEDLPKVMNGRSVTHYPIPDDELMLD